MQTNYLTESKISWLTRKLWELFDYKYDTEKIYETLLPIYESKDDKRYKYLTALMYGKEKDILEKELNLTPTQN